MAVYIKLLDGSFGGETRKVTSAGLNPLNFFYKFSEKRLAMGGYL